MKLLLSIIIFIISYTLYYQYRFTMVAMIIVATEVNNDGNNIKWLFVVVLQGVCCFTVGSFLETSVWVGCFDKVVGHHVSSNIQLVLLYWCFLGDILLFRSGIFQGIFLVANSYFNLLLNLYYPLLFSLFYTFWVFAIATYVHYYIVRFCFT